MNIFELIRSKINCCRLTVKMHHILNLTLWNFLCNLPNILVCVSWTQYSTSYLSESQVVPQLFTFYSYQVWEADELMFNVYHCWFDGCVCELLRQLVVRFTSVTFAFVFVFVMYIWRARFGTKVLCAILKYV